MDLRYQNTHDLLHGVLLDAFLRPDLATSTSSPWLAALVEKRFVPPLRSDMRSWEREVGNGKGGELDRLLDLSHGLLRRKNDNLLDTPSWRVDSTVIIAVCGTWAMSRQPSCPHHSHNTFPRHPICEVALGQTTTVTATTPDKTPDLPHHELHVHSATLSWQRNTPHKRRCRGVQWLKSAQNSKSGA